MHEKLYWGLPHCVLSPDRWLTVWCVFFPFPFFFSPAPKKEGILEGAAERLDLAKEPEGKHCLGPPLPFTCTSPKWNWSI